MKVHFLGFSATEGGIVTVNETIKCDLGIVDLETMEREFDDFEFTVPYSPVFEIKPQVNSMYLLRDSINHARTTIKLTSFSEITEQYMWLENERILITGFELNDTYDIARGQNGSIAIQHTVGNTVGNIKGEYAGLNLTLKRLSPLGLIVKVYDEGVIYGYGQITECIIKNDSVVNVKCKHIANQLENTLVVANSNIQSGNYNEFMALGGQICGKQEKSENNGFLWVIKDNGKALYNQLNFTNKIMYFENGLFKFKELKRMANQVATKVKIEQTKTVDGAFELSTCPIYSSVIVKLPDDGEVTFTASDSNFTREYTQAKVLELDFSAQPYDVSKLQDIALQKLYTMNSFLEKIKMNVDRYTKRFVIGNYYDFTDIYKFTNFYKNLKERIFFCVGVDNNEATFLRTEFYNVSYVAPSFLVKRISNTEFQLVNYNIYNGITSDTADLISEQGNFLYNTLGDITFLGNSIFKNDDYITLCRADGTFENSVYIANITSDTITVNTTISGSNGEIFVLTIQSDVAFDDLDEKNKVYIYETSEAFL